MQYKLAPSDLTFLYEGCKHCFVLKVKHSIPQPSIPLPSVFTRIADLQKQCYSGKPTAEFCPDLPRGTVVLGEKSVCSEAIGFDDLESTCYIRGRFDVVVDFDDGSYGVIDFKTGNPDEEKVSMYGRQLHAYALALEHPADEALALDPISRLGLLCFEPNVCGYEENTNQQLVAGHMNWREVPKDEDVFQSFLHDVVSLLDGPLPPPQPETCDWCRYRSRIMESTNGTHPGTQPHSVDPPHCPNCGSHMTLRTGKYGDFWGCSGYPQCCGTRQV